MALTTICNELAAPEPLEEALIFSAVTYLEHREATTTAEQRAEQAAVDMDYLLVASYFGRHMEVRERTADAVNRGLDTATKRLLAACPDFSPVIHRLKPERRDVLSKRAKTLVCQSLAPRPSGTGETAFLINLKSNGEYGNHDARSAHLARVIMNRQILFPYQQPAIAA